MHQFANAYSLITAEIMLKLSIQLEKGSTGNITDKKNDDKLCYFASLNLVVWHTFAITQHMVLIQPSDSMVHSVLFTTAAWGEDEVGHI